MESISKTAVASGYSPTFGGSPVMSSMFLSPSACAPSISDWRPMIFRSRQQTWRMVSIPANSWILTAVAMGDRRELALGPSGILMASIPCSAHIFAFFSVLVRSAPLGGVNSTEVIFPPSDIICPIRERSANGTISETSVTIESGSGFENTTGCLAMALSMALTAAPIFLMWSGEVPQHPPMILAPFS